MIYEEDVEEFLDHHGVKGQKWGVRRHQKQVKKQQQEVDVYRRVASGKGGRVDRALVAIAKSTTDIALNRSAQDVARIRLEKARTNQAKIKAGESRARAILAKVAGVHVKELNYSYDKNG